jgi:hypothetical protein
LVARPSGFDASRLGSETGAMCIWGWRAYPPRDVGGIWGHYHLLKAMQDPDHNHERHLE